MSLFDGKMSPFEREQHVAVMLGYPAHKPDTWPIENIQRLLARAEREAEHKIAADVDGILISRTVCTPIYGTLHVEPWWRHPHKYAHIEHFSMRIRTAICGRIS